MPTDTHRLAAWRWRRRGLTAFVQMGLADDARTRLLWLVQLLTAELNAYLIEHPERADEHRALWAALHELRAVFEGRSA